MDTLKAEGFQSYGYTESGAFQSYGYTESGGIPVPWIH